MKKFLISIFAFLFYTLHFTFCTAYAASRVSIREEWFYVDGKRFFIKGVGYEPGCRAGRLPWARQFEPEILEHDFKLIEKAGMNTIRTWGPLTDQELLLAKKYNLMVIQGLWIDYNKYFTSDAYVKTALASVKEEVKKSKKFDNILMYLVMNEPNAGLLMNAGSAKVNELFAKLRDAVKEADPDRPVSFSNCPLADFIDWSVWDVVCSNNYMYGPDTINKCLGYRAYNEWLKRTHAKDKPLIITEFGLSVSSSGPGKYGYGGNTLQEQSDGMIYMYENLVAAGATGACPFMWADGWWKSPEAGPLPGHERIHDPHPEEWFGIINVEDPSRDIKGSPRPVYYALKEFNNLIVIEPKQMGSYSGKVPVEIFTGKDITGIQCRIDNGKWNELSENEKGLWKGEIDIDDSAAAGIIEIRDSKNSVKKVPVIVSTGTDAPLDIKVLTDKTEYKSGETSEVKVSVKDVSGKPAAGCTVTTCVYDYRSGSSQIEKKKTDSTGLAPVDFSTFLKSGYFSFAASVDYEKKDFGKRTLGDMKIIHIEPDAEFSVERFIKGRENILLDSFEYEKPYEAGGDFAAVFTGQGELERNGDPARKVHGKSSLNLLFTPRAKTTWAYTDKKFSSIQNLSKYNYMCVSVNRDDSDTELKIMLIDKDGERWLDRSARMKEPGWEKMLFNLKGLTRDPYDGIKDGDGKHNPDMTKGLALVLVTDNGRACDINIDEIRVYK